MKGKEIIIIITILILVIGSNILINKYIKNSSELIINLLKELKETMKSQEQDSTKLSKEANKIFEKWQETEEKWAIIVLHSELDQIEIALIKMKTEIEENNLDDAQEELETSIFLLNHINEKERFCIKNIF